MLTIQRASAGSGKTYVLTRIFILNLIAYKNESGKWRLRNYRQIEDALNHILAITFTNKATNEMKQRIVESLSLLSGASNLRDSKSALDKIPYLKDFIKITGFSANDIAKASQDALSVILNNYSKFKISTIDSFFQEILRTFTYEANLNDSYQLEIDSSYVVEAAIEAAINELDTHPENMGNAEFWLKTLMNEKAKTSQRWNPFDKNFTTGSIYNQIKSALFKLENEDFKIIKEDLDNYFNTKDKIKSLISVYKSLKEKAIKERDAQLKDLVKRAKDIEDYILKNNIPYSHLYRYLKNHINEVNALNLSKKVRFKYQPILDANTIFKSDYYTENHPLDAIAIPFYKKVKEWNNPSPDSYFKNWKIYGPLMPFLGLILEIRAFLADVLESNNIIRISDTGFILNKIIGDDDAPFIYERLGNRLDHYLIDEFQDTSRLQWEVIYPLLNEGVAKERESLIIGDPKQSIYRFRNADHKLILEDVPEAFRYNHEATGFSKEENTNWRSHTNVVKFNNFFFKNLAFALNKFSREKGGGFDFLDLYSNVVQYPINQKGKGYVEIRLYDSEVKKNNTAADEAGQDDLNDSLSSRELIDLIKLISSLLDRGYEPKDIGILVNKNEQSSRIIEELIHYNDNVDEDKKINFISDDSLLISSSKAVEIILGVFEKLTKPGIFIQKDDIHENSNYSKINWYDIEVGYKIFSLKHPELGPLQKITSYLSSKGLEESLPSLIDDVSTPTLSALVEQIIKSLLDENLRISDAVYLSAFQDIITEYSTHHVNDPASFLEWWRSKGSGATISTPDSVNAVQIMTIHKSKGLEFKCVIIPFASNSFTPSHLKAEWRWVNPSQLKDLELPPVLPVSTTSELVGSEQQPVYNKYVDEVLTDNINTYYVAFTRAKNELYIFSKKDGKDSSNSISSYLSNILKGNIKFNDFSPEEMESLLEHDKVKITEDESVISYGEPFTTEEIEAEYVKEKEKKETGHSPEIHIMKEYFVNDKRPKLRSVASKADSASLF